MKSILRNSFFQAALTKGATLAGKYSRILKLVTQLGIRLQHTDWRSLTSNGVKDKFVTIGRFAKAYADGKYRSVSLKSVVMILGAIVYFVNPLDLIPDLMPVVGLTDDVGVLLWVYNALGVEVDKFISWEKVQRA